MPPTRLTGRLELSTDVGSFLGDTRVRLLEAIAQHGSISQAAKHVPLSYKAAWDAVDAMNNLADQALVERTTGGRAGGGTRLTEHGERVVAMYRAMEREMQAALDRLASRFSDAGEGDVAGFQHLLRRMSVRISARNQFVGTVKRLTAGDVNVEVLVELDDGVELTANVTRGSASDLALVPGREVIVLVKAPAMQVETREHSRAQGRNRLWGTVQRIVKGPTNAEVTLDLGKSRTVTAVVPRAVLDTLALKRGERACASFKVSSALLAVVQ